MEDNVTPVRPVKGFRQPPQPTKGEVQKENQTLTHQLQQRVNSLQKFFLNISNQLMQKTKVYDITLDQMDRWEASFHTEETAQNGDHLLIDYAGVLLSEDGTEAKIKWTNEDGTEAQMADVFDAGKLTRVVTLGSGSFIPGFEEQLVGLKYKESKNFDIEFPKDYHVENLKGKKAKFYVFVWFVRRPYPNSPVGEMIDEYQRIKNELKAKALAEAQTLATKAKADAEATDGSEPNTVQAAETTTETAPEAPTESQG